MRICEERIKELKVLTAEVAQRTAIDELERLRHLSLLAYAVRKSTSFERFLQANLERRPEPGVSVPTASKILERLGKISRIYRAALTIARFMTAIRALGRELTVELILTAQIPILTSVSKANTSVATSTLAISASTSSDTTLGSKSTVATSRCTHCGR